jgi:glycosyltransferase involved in cell wall biosynthesis
VTKFSVIIPTYNRAHVIDEALDSVLAQSYQDFEILVIDDGSADNTREVLCPYFDRIRYFKQANSGPAAARNRGITESQGEYVAFLDSDDRWYPDKLAQIDKVIDAHPDAGLFYSDYQLVDEQHSHLWIARSKHIMGDGYHQLLLGNFIGTSTVVVKRECFDVCGLFYRDLFSTQDWDMWIRIAREFSIVHVPAVLVEYTWQSRGAVTASPKALGNTSAVIERSLEADPHINRRQRIQIKARQHHRDGVTYLRHREKERALSYFSKSIQVAPLFYKSYVYWILLKTGAVDLLPRKIKLRLRIL